MDIKPLLEDLGIDKMPTDKQEQAIASLIRTLNNRVGIRLASELSEEDLAKFEQLSAKEGGPTEEELNAANPRFVEIYSEEVEKLRQDFKAMRA